MLGDTRRLHVALPMYTWRVDTIRNPADTSAIGQHFRTITRTDSVINVDTSANVRSTQDSFHVSIDLDVRINGLPHHQRRWVETFKRELL